jgi:hypothetical protein
MYLRTFYSLGQAAGIGGIIARWEKLYFNPFPTEEELGSIAVSGYVAESRNDVAISSDSALWGLL